MNFGLNRMAGGGVGQALAESPQTDARMARQRTLREQLQDQIAYHRSKIADLEEACEALTPDVEKALNALQKLS